MFCDIPQHFLANAEIVSLKYAMTAFSIIPIIYDHPSNQKYDKKL
jgi:hypothetical protein